MEDKFSVINKSVPTEREQWKRIALTKDACAEIIKAIKSTFCIPIEDYIDHNIGMSYKALINKFKDVFLYSFADCTNGFKWNNMSNLVNTFSFEKPNEFKYDDFLKWYKAIFKFDGYYNNRISDYRINSGIFEEKIDENAKCEHTPVFSYAVNIDHFLEDDKELDAEDYENSIPCLMASEAFPYQNIIGSFVNTAEKFAIVKQDKINNKNLNNCKPIKDCSDTIRIIINDYDLLANYNIDEIQLVYKLKLSDASLTDTKIYIRLKNGIVIDNDNGSNGLFNLVYKTIRSIEDFYKKLITAFREDNKNTYDENSIKMSEEVLKAMNMYVPKV